MSKQELIEELRKVDEVTLLEILEINSSELIDAFLDKIEEKLEYLKLQIDD
jgi:hypothetical protein